MILYLLGREGWIREGYYISLLLGFVLLNVPAGISYELAEVLFWFNRMRWAAAVSEWNKGQSFRDDMYAIPKKGGEFYNEIRQIMGIKTREPEPKPEPKVELKIEPKVETKVKSEIPIADLAEYHNALAGRRPRGVIAYYENKYPQLKNKLKK